ncbi:hypothetical protein SLEP1_g31946 [Rubroshorea leprosula]|uniref:Uncharacterized protein n=1 Tax=Rubroshorea leprosula TaxID=152421 RepID=A0AAV5KBS5_9ROSI|nr:hypothetical protein SLEP1_g31946 [Rubroshorea leprosula]
MLSFGPVDSSLSKRQSLSVICLDGNNMVAPIPEFFIELRNLTSLQLAATNLQGKVPEKIFQFKGELPYHWLRTWKAMMVASDELKVLVLEEDIHYELDHNNRIS